MNYKDVKKGNSIKFVNDVTYCTKSDFLVIAGQQVGGIVIDKRWCDTASPKELREMWVALDFSGFVKDDNFVIPAGTIAKVESIDFNEISNIYLTDRILVQMATFYWFFETPANLDEEIQIELVSA